jgi:hypothetical protein
MAPNSNAAIGSHIRFATTVTHREPPMGNRVPSSL